MGIETLTNIWAATHHSVVINILRDDCRQSDVSYHWPINLPTLESNYCIEASDQSFFMARCCISNNTGGSSIWETAAGCCNFQHDWTNCQILAPVYPAIMYIYICCDRQIKGRRSLIARFNMGLIWGRQDPCGPHVGPLNFAIWDDKRPLQWPNVSFMASKFARNSTFCLTVCSR